MKIKKIFLILLLMLLTGCSANYTIVLNENNSVSEKLVTKLEDNENNYNKVLNLLKNNNISKKNYKITREDDEINIEYDNTYKDINSYLLNSFLYKQVYDQIDLQMNNSKNTISTKNKFMKDTISINKDNVTSLDFLQININSKLPVIYSNADSINDNVYSWVYDGSQTEKNINFSYKNVPTIITIKSILIISLMIVSILSISIIIYRRMNSIQRL